MKKLKEIIKNNYILSWLLFKALRYKYKGWNRMCEERKNMDLFNYMEFAKDLPLGLSHPIIDNNLYGLHEVLCEYGQMKTVSHKIFFEHGVVFGSLVQKHALTSFANKILTFSEYREQYVNKYDKKVIKIGPYIHYADYIVSDAKFAEMRHKLGRVLLVFPSHSIKSLKKEYDLDSFLAKIKECAKGFDNVIVCLYWKDIQLGRARIYEDAGFLVMTAGHFHDKYFLHRLKTIIGLSDMTMSNDIGTHLGYCIYLGKPHYIFGQDVKLEALNAKMNTEISQRSEDDWKSYYDVKDDIVQVFNVMENDISSTQYDMVAKIWGLNEILSREQIRNCLH